MAGKKGCPPFKTSFGSSSKKYYDLLSYEHEYGLCDEFGLREMTELPNMNNPRFVRVRVKNDDPVKNSPPIDKSSDFMFASQNEGALFNNIENATYECVRSCEYENKDLLMGESLLHPIVPMSVKYTSNKKNDNSVDIKQETFKDDLLDSPKGKLKDIEIEYCPICNSSTMMIESIENSSQTMLEGYEKASQTVSLKKIDSQTNTELSEEIECEIIFPKTVWKYMTKNINVIRIFLAALITISISLYFTNNLLLSWIFEDNSARYSNNFFGKIWAIVWR